MTIDELRAEDWPACARIFEAGLDVGTFEETVPAWEEWDASHLASPRLVARDGERSSAGRRWRRSRGGSATAA